MLRTVLCSTLALVAGSAVVAYADAKEDAAGAAQKLADSQNYSWKQTTESASGQGRGGGPMEGKTEKGGVTMLVITFGDNTRTTFRKGDKVVTQNQDGEWMTAEEMAAARGNGGGGQGRRGRGAGGPQQMRLPAETVSDLISKANNLALADGVITGQLSEDAVKSLMTFGGRGRRGGGGGGGGNPPEVSNAKGTLKVWTKDGVLSKFEYHVTGTVSRGGNDMDVDRTTTVEISDVGSTKIEVPEAAAKKLG
jgi:hypothetical protein